jgi:hypothetical protein
MSIDGTESRRRYKVILTLVATLNMPVTVAGTDPISQWKNLSAQAISALDAPFMSIARWGAIADHPDWLYTGSAVGVCVYAY